eukprot:gnl/TRDRNA2_/TRDRNA2_186672_c0_seq1.p1 gnl/TRDRNA2_/TRDRNA2_186672_c0~~gnl/TRDRNA2_/TRDRNA2_186672_c0_seq1.p1  ORF type:complete len:443 (+),score=93.45 gnl/TRDRNA2_/TRDRNA2_186672_c0_seq1:134-1330(+)
MAKKRIATCEEEVAAKKLKMSDTLSSTNLTPVLEVLTDTGRFPANATTEARMILLQGLPLASKAEVLPNGDCQLHEFQLRLLQRARRMLHSDARACAVTTAAGCLEAAEGAEADKRQHAAAYAYAMEIAANAASEAEIKTAALSRTKANLEDAELNRDEMHSRLQRARAERRDRESEKSAFASLTDGPFRMLQCGEHRNETTRQAAIAAIFQQVDAEHTLVDAARVSLSLLPEARRPFDQEVIQDLIDVMETHASRLQTAVEDAVVKEAHAEADVLAAEYETADYSSTARVDLRAVCVAEGARRHADDALKYAETSLEIAKADVANRHAELAIAENRVEQLDVAIAVLDRIIWGDTFDTITTTTNTNHLEAYPHIKIVDAASTANLPVSREMAARMGA